MADARNCYIKDKIKIRELAMSSAAIAPPNRPVADLEWLVSSLTAAGIFDELSLLRLRSRTRDTGCARSDVGYLASADILGAGGEVLSGEKLAQWLAEIAQLPSQQINPLKVDVDQVTAVMSKAYALNHEVLCLEVSADELLIAVADPFREDWQEGLLHTSRKRIRVVVADATALQRYTEEFYALARSVAGAGAQAKQENRRSAPKGLEQLVDLKSLQSPEANDQHIVNIVDWLLQYAFEQRASDIHIEPKREQSRVRFRIDGELQTVYDLPSEVNAAVTSRFKVLARMDVAEKRRPQDGRIKTRTPKQLEVELRLSTLPTAFGEKLVIRIFDPEVLLRTFSSLGLRGGDLRSWETMTAKPHGIVLVTGPTGSGKTTTLYSSLKKLSVESVNVSTIEDPIEMVEESFNQMQVQNNIGLDFAAGVRTLLRQDPDIIMIGEIRDRETAEMAVQAALTGHLVLSTLHTNDAPSSITRLMEFGVPHYLIKSTLIGVMAQRLVRVLCSECKTSASVSDEAWQTLCQPFRIKKPTEVFEPNGCKSCRHTGFHGREGIYEVLEWEANLTSLVGSDGATEALRTAAYKNGMKSLRAAGALKVAAGITTLDEVYRVTPAES
ncbi:general secretion pathway protein E [Umboniibacter marinipuniceus]|uniref:General secretion pathway protein E n=2 Tax=Umboniibacter marinipuniceus TaxID=569599 RepID=A0A3M0A6G9_9GAMM|nr:general secretion pathway protein E [Umboniibacter marinipuniceus]